MKKLLLLLVIILLSIEFTSAQNRQNARIEAEKIAFFTRRMDLTPDEATVFWPVYNEFANKRNKINREKNALLQRNTNRTTEEIDETTLEENGDKIVEYMIEEAELTKEYHKRFKEILPPEKVIRIYQTEVLFNRILLDQLRNQRSQQQAGRRRIPS